jgi:hypothetical protein
MLFPHINVMEFIEGIYLFPRGYSTPQSTP